MTYYSYDATTKKYLGEVEADSQPENSTVEKPVTVLNGKEVALVEPVFDEDLGGWVESYSALAALQQQVAFLTNQLTLLNSQTEGGASK